MNSSDPATSTDAATTGSGTLRTARAIAAQVPRLAGPILAGAGLAERYRIHRGPVLAAAFAYYALLSVVPAAIAAGSIAALTRNPEAVQQAVENAEARLPELTEGGGQVITGLLDVVANTSTASLGWTSVVSLVLALFAASRVLVTMRVILDVAFDRPPTERGWLVRLLASVIVLAVLVVLVLGLVVLQSAPRVLETFDLPTELASLLDALTIPLSVVITWLLFSLVYRVASPRSARVRLINRGGAVATAIALVGTIGTVVYVQFSGSLGAAVAVLGGAVVVLLWLYVLGIALVIGAEIQAERTRIAVPE